MEFKLSKNGLTRRVLFVDQPVWTDLATKIATLYDIPPDAAAVSYVDADGDSVTLSTNDELQDFYRTGHKFGVPIKFEVLELARADPNKPLPDMPDLGARNTFGSQPPGIPLVFEVPDDAAWPPRMSSFGGLYGLGMEDESDAPHAFVETVPSDADTSMSDLGNIISPTLNKGKGKGRAKDDETESIVSVLAAGDPDKQPVHVFDVSDRGMPSAQAFGINNPMRRAQNATPAQSDVTARPAPATFPDPPTPPPLESMASGLPSTSLYQDVAALLNTASNILSQHPELSEGLRNLVRNASSGMYWEDAQRAAGDVRQGAEEEAKRRVADAIGGMFNALGGSPPPSTSTPVPHDIPLADSTADGASARFPAVEDLFKILGMPGRRQGTGTSQVDSSVDPFLTPLYARRRSTAPFPPPQPAPPTDTRQPSSSTTPATAVPDSASPAGSPTAAMEESRARLELAKKQYQDEKERYRRERDERRKDRDRNRVVSDEPRTMPPQAAPPAPARTRKDSAPQAGVAGPSSSRTRGILPAWQLVSNARGQYPQLEMTSVTPPTRVTRNNTVPGRRLASDPVNQADSTGAKSSKRISRKLAEMGFTNDKYPRISGMLEDRVRPSSILTRVEEDEIVTKMLEDILSFSPKTSPTASRRNSTMPADPQQRA